MSAVGDARKRTHQTPAGTLTDTEREALGPFIWGAWIGVAEGREGDYSRELQTTVADIKAAAVAAALAPIEALADSWPTDDNGQDYRRGVIQCANAIRAALAGGGDRG